MKEKKDCNFLSCSIKKKIMFAFGIMFLLILTLAGSNYIINTQIQSDAVAIKTIHAPLKVMVEQVIGYDAMLTGNAHAALLHAIEGETAGIAEHKAEYDQIGIKLDNLLKVEAKTLIEKGRRSDEDKEKVYGYLDELDIINLKLVDLETRAFAAMEKGDTDTAYSLIVSEQYHNYKKQLADLYLLWLNEEQKRSEYYNQRLMGNTLKIKIVNEILSILFIIFASVIPFFIIKSIIKPINKLAHIAEEIGAGNIDIKISSDLKKRGDEIGKLAQAYDKLITSSHFALKTLIELKILGKYKTLYTSSKDAIMITEPPNWKFTSGNSATLKMFNVKDEKQFNLLTPEDLSPKKQPDGQLSSVKARKMIEKAMKEGSNFFEWTHKRYRGEDFPATVLLSRVKEGGKTYLQATVRDLTQIKKRVN
jgi:PAS domain S-box-containing protein